MSNIFITGGTGFLGSMLIDEILTSSEDIVHALVRGKNPEEARERIVSILRDITEGGTLSKEKLNRIKVYPGDITKRGLGIKKDTLKELADKIDIIYNNAAITDLTLPLGKIRKVNVSGTKNVLDFALSCKKNGKLKRVNHISTAYVVGTKKCTFHENDLYVGQRFNNTYERSKYEAEKLVHKYRKTGLNINVFRPGIILGRYSDGKTSNFKMFYQPLHYFALELFDRIPALKNSKANLINVDTTARAIFLTATLSNEENTTYHITSPEAPDFRYVLEVASDYFGFKVPDFVPADEFDMRREYSHIQREMISPFIPYFNYSTTFSMDNTVGWLKQDNFKFHKFDEKNLIKLFEYCSAYGFIKRKKANVVVR